MPQPCKGENGSKCDQDCPKLIQHIFRMNHLIGTLLALLVLASPVLAANYFTPKSAGEVMEAFRRYDKNNNKVLDELELKNYFQHDYMKPFEGIDIDPKFIDGALKSIKEADIDHNGISPEELVAAIIPNEKQPSSREPQHYPEQEL